MNSTYKSRGFTLVELVTVMIIVGVLAVAVLPKFESAGFQSQAAADQVKAALRYGQKLAIAQHRAISITISSAGSTSCNLTLSGSSISCAIKNDVTLSASPTITFDALGKPGASSSFTVGGTTITIEAETGYVH